MDGDGDEEGDGDGDWHGHGQFRHGKYRVSKLCAPYTLSKYRATKLVPTHCFHRSGDSALEPIILRY